MCNAISKIILVIVNVIVGIVALTFAVVGGLLAWNRSVLKKIIDSGVKAIEEHLKADTKVIDEVTERILQFSSPAGIAIFVFALLVLVITTIGFIGACCGIRCLLIVYAIIIGVFILAHIVLIIVYFARKDLITDFLHKTVKDFMKKYKQLKHNDVDSWVGATIMQMGQCCGYSNGTEFTTTVGYEFINNDVVDGKEYKDLKAPVPCCIGQPQVGDNNCPKSMTPLNSYFENGCEMKLDDKVIPVLDKVMYFSLILLAIMIIVCILAIRAK